MTAKDEHFLKIIDSTPLVSIDLILRNTDKQVLLGKRVNRPAQGYWFVPGGRIKKNERIYDAMKRIASNELGIDITELNPNLLDVYDHIYTDNYLGVDGINTHYVVLAYTVNIEDDIKIVTDNQHSEVKWWPIASLLSASDVHQNTKVYFPSRVR